MRSTSKVVNPRVVVWLFCRWLTTWCSHYMKAITVLLYRNYSKMYNIWMFCFAEDNKIISGIDNTITKLDLKPIFNTLPIIRGCRPGDNLLSPSTWYMFGLFSGLSPSSTNFLKSIQIVLSNLQGIININLNMYISDYLKEPHYISSGSPKGTGI